MQVMKQYLEDCIKHTEMLMEKHDHEDRYSHKHMDYIECYLDHTLKVMAVLAGKHALEKFWATGDMQELHAAAHATKTSLNL